MRKGKKGEKKGIPLFFPHPRNNSLEKKNSLSLPIPLNKTPSFFKFTKTQHLKDKNPFESQKNLDI
jgi:hypothetical protein